jgi:hypothetical protein
MFDVYVYVNVSTPSSFTMEDLISHSRRTNLDRNPSRMKIKVVDEIPYFCLPFEVFM